MNMKNLNTIMNNRSNKSLDTTRAKRPESWTQQGEFNPNSFTTVS